MESLFRFAATVVLLGIASTPVAAAVTTVHVFNFTGPFHPEGTLLRDADANLYGATFWNGQSSDGAIYKLSPDGTFTPLYSFDGSTGGTPKLYVLGSDGNLYGFVGYSEAGSIFRITPDGDLTYLHTFDFDDGAQVNSLIQARDGHLYGTTTYGGSGTLHSGTVFRLTLAGELTTLVSFSYNEPSGGFPRSLIQGSDGALYGTTTAGGGGFVGQGNEGGTVFRLSQALGSWQLQTLHSFPTYHGAAYGLAEGSSGVFYGTAGGKIFRLTRNGQYTELGSLAVLDSLPILPPMRGPDGHFYVGTGGHYYATEGALIRFSPAGEAKIVESVPAGELTPGQGRSYYSYLPWDNQIIRIDLDGLPTRLEPRAEILDTNVHLRMKAVIRAVDSGTALAGKTVKFFTPTGSLLCSAVSDSTGTAACGNPVTYVRTTFNQQYLVTFAGDAEHAASTATGVLVK
jgi:uncharacterized repeat protein (TIGR03803 family)